MVKRSSKRIKTSHSYTEELGIDDLEEDGFIEGDINDDNPIAVFSFGMSADLNNSKTITEQQAPISKPLSTSIVSTGPNKGAIKGLTPSIDGEQFSLKRGYQFRPSTVRKLNELKNKHPDINVYLNTVLDAAILHYYNYIFNENGEF